MLLSEAFKSYCDDVIVFKNQSPKTEENHYIVMKNLLRYFGDIEMSTLTFPMVRDWKNAISKDRTPRTVRNYIIRLRVVLEYLRVRGDDVLKPDQVPVPKVGDRVPEFIVKEEVAKLIRSVSKKQPGYSNMNRLRNATMISVLYSYGLRVSELCALNINSIQDDGSFTVIGKGKKARLCFMDERSMRLIKTYLAHRTDNNPALFISAQNGKRVTPGVVQEVFRLANRKAVLRKVVTPHTLRHSFATNLLRNSTNIRYVQVMLGHASLETTQMYSHVVDTDLHKVFKESHTI